MFCPQCKAEYRQGFTRCADCEVDLISALPQNLSEEPNAPEGLLRSVWGGSGELAFADVCEKLGDAGIPFKVIRREDRLFNTHNYPNLQIAVPQSLYDKALELAGDPSELMPADEAEAEAMLGLPAQDHVSATSDRHADWGPGSWYPEDATVEVWSEGSDNLTWMVESCLRENYIRSRTDILDDGSRKIFVLPEAEFRAREIVREIVQATPPE